MKTVAAGLVYGAWALPCGRGMAVAAGGVGEGNPTTVERT